MSAKSLRLAGVVLAFTAGVVIAATPNLDTFKGCGLTGTAGSVCGKKLNRLKNRYVDPTAASKNASITMDAILAPGDDRTRWSSSDSAEIIAIVANVKPGGEGESCNCGKPSLRDIHIELVVKQSDVNKPDRRVIAEITPRMQKLHPEWTFNFISAMKGKRVRVAGWMMFDGMHSAESANTKAFAQQCGSLRVHEIWRATAWEIHPITKIELAE